MASGEGISRYLSHVNKICWDYRDRGSLFPLQLPGGRQACRVLLVAIFIEIWAEPTEGEVDAGGKQSREEGTSEGIIIS